MRSMMSAARFATLVYSLALTLRDSEICCMPAKASSPVANTTEAIMPSIKVKPEWLFRMRFMIQSSLACLWTSALCAPCHFPSGCHYERVYEAPVIGDLNGPGRRRQAQRRKLHRRCRTDVGHVRHQLN